MLDSDDIHEEIEEEIDTSNPFRDNKLHVLSEKCSTCIFRPGNPMNLVPGRLQHMVRDTVQNDSYIVCHQTLDINHEYDAEPAVCKGFFDSYTTNPLRVASRLNLIEFDQHPSKSKVSK